MVAMVGLKTLATILLGTMTHAPVLLIANRATASASEVLAGALRENGR
jgi:C-terminal processing protease CtpA/Prc